MKKNKSIEALVETADRFQVSNTGLAHLVNEVWSAEGIITEKDQSKFLYKKKVERVIKKTSQSSTVLSSALVPSLILVLVPVLDVM